MKVLLSNTQDPAKMSSASALGDCSLGLCYLASYARKYGSKENEFEFKIVTNVLEGLNSFHPDVVGLGTTTRYFDSIPDLCRKIKEFDKGIKIVLGGHHITAVPDCLPEDADYAVLGEGEQAFLDILEGRAERGNVKRSLIEPLDHIPFPARDLVKLEKNKWVNQISSRGCPYSCIFCSSSRFWGKARYHSAKYVVDEIETLGVKRIVFQDDLFIGDRNRLRELAGLYEQRNLDVELSCTVRANLVDDELVGLLGRLNVRRVTYGAESGCERTLQYLKCGTVSVKQNLEAVQLLKKNGFIVSASFIVGAPTETFEEASQTLKLIQDAPLDDADLYVLTPYPNTPLYDGETRDWSRFHQLNANCMTAKNLSFTEITQLLQQFAKIKRHKQRKQLLKAGLHKPWKIYGFLREKIIS